MFVYYANTLCFRAWILEDTNNRPIDIDGLNAEMFVKRSNDAPEALLHLTTNDGSLQLFADEALQTSWLELNVETLPLEPGDYVFYVFLLFPQKQLLEHSHLLVMSDAEMEITP
jgi:hypothetical protein